MFPHTFAHYIAGKSVQMHRGQHRGERVLRMLCNHARDQPSQNVSRTPGRHSRIARRVDPCFAIRPHHQSAMPFEHDDQFVFARELPRHAQSIFLDVRNAQSRQPRHLARMRSDRQRPILAIQFVRAAFERIQSIGIHHHGELEFRDQISYQLRSLRMTRNPRPNRNHALAFRQFLNSISRAH